MQRNLSVTFGKDVVNKRIEKVMFKLWIEAIDNKNKTDKFFGFQLQKRVFDHFISVVKKNQWLKQQSELCKTLAIKGIKRRFLKKMFEAAKRKSQLRSIYLTKLETSQVVLKQQIIYELKSYADKKRHWAQIEYHTVMQLRLSKKKQLFKELSNYTAYKQQLKIAEKKANLKLK